jgi:hypothetical protein
MEVCLLLRLLPAQSLRYLDFLATVLLPTLCSLPRFYWSIFYAISCAFISTMLTAFSCILHYTCCTFCSSVSGRLMGGGGWEVHTRLQ